MNEVRVFGPPGTGKTTYLARQVNNAAEKKGSARIMVASFTRAAATEIAGRNIPVDKSQIGTLHALCFRALGRPDLTEGHLADWNKHSPHLAFSGKGADLDHAAYDQHGESQGDRLMSQAEMLRAKMRPIDTWPTSVRSFFNRWTEWKDQNGYLDFTDLIEKNLNSPPPGSPKIGFFDEVQDFTPLDLALVRNWAVSMDTVLLAGDDDQCIYRFRGASPDAFLDPPVDDDHKRVLAQSYRVPEKVHGFAQKWVEQLSRREPKDYKPRDEEGAVYLRLDVNWRSPGRLIDEIEQEEDPNRTFMFLTATSYMLDPTVAELRRRGIPFHNPYRRKRGDWNPLAPRKDAVTAVDRILAYLRPQIEVWGGQARIWDAVDAHRWVSVMGVADTLHRGAKKILDKRAGDMDDMHDLDLAWMLEHILQDPNDLARALDGDLDWWESKLLQSTAKPIRFPLQVARQHGANILRETPRVIVGTIHSVKGGEADTVYMFPDLSNSGMREWLTRGEAKDSVIRQFYVGATRARHTLAIAGPLTKSHVPLNRFI